MEIVVFGAGSLGSLVGGLLAHEHTVTLVGRDPHVEAIQTDGLSVSGAFDRVIHPRATTDGRDLDGDLAIVTVKAYDTADIAEVIATGCFDVVCSLQNGLGNEDTLSDRIEVPILAGITTYGAMKRSPGTVECTGRGEISVGPWTEGAEALTTMVADAFVSAGIETTFDRDMALRLWEKVAVNGAINPITALASIQNGSILEEPARSLARATTREIAKTARAYDVSLSNRRAVSSMESVAKATAANHSSMRLDKEAERRTEIDAINGAVISKADGYAIDVPTNRLLVDLIRTWERENGIR